MREPVLELYDASGSPLAGNNDWQETQAQALLDANLAPAHDLESAILATLAPGAYTAVLRGNGGATGIGLVEVYDLQSGAASKLGNLSTRGTVGTGQGVMIGGTIVTGRIRASCVRALGHRSLPSGIKIQYRSATRFVRRERREDFREQ